MSAGIHVAAKIILLAIHSTVRITIVITIIKLNLKVLPS